MTLGSMDKVEGSAAQLIQLEPLIHQVGGHSSLWVLDDDTICKPLIGREAKFYRTLPAQMKNFTPEFRGTVKVVVQKSSEGVAVAALPSRDMKKRNSHKSLVTGTTSKSKHHANSSKVRRVSGNRSKEKEDSAENAATSFSIATAGESSTSLQSSLPFPVPPLVPQPPPDTHNPWLKECHQKYLNKFRHKESSNSIIDCILLENLTHVYRIPNVLDLKMGTRQYGDDAPESKRKSQTRKALHTTTPRLGVRLAGMQVFDRETKRYVCKNKYVGRELTEEGFKQTLRHFLYNGKRFRLDIVEQIISKLSDLRATIAKLDSFRFFTSSLLILYDSYDAKSSSSKKEMSNANSKENNVQTSDKNSNSTTEGKDGSNKSLNSDSHQSDRLDAKKDKCLCPKERTNINGTSSVPKVCPVCLDADKKTKELESCLNSNASDSAISESPRAIALKNCQKVQLRSESVSSLSKDRRTPQNSLDESININSETQDLPESGKSNDQNRKSSEKESEHRREDLNSFQNSSLDSSNSSVEGMQSCRTKVDIRLIDFAHSTHKGMGDSTIYSGPDEGIMLGLQSLINIFTNLKEVYSK